MTRTGFAVAVAALAGLAFFVAACGGDTQAGSENGQTPAASEETPGAPAETPEGAVAPSGEPSAVNFAQCMRENGVSNFPDPSPNGGVMIDGSVASSPNFAQAAETCAPLRPLGGENTAGGQADPEALLEFARCMRENGVPDFPDPDPSTSGGGAQMGPGSGPGNIDPNSPVFQAAAEECGSDFGIQIRTPGN